MPTTTLTPPTSLELTCPEDCQTEWLFYEDHPVRFGVAIDEDGTIIVQDAEYVDYEFGFDRRFMCSGCGHEVPALNVEFTFAWDF